MKTFTETQKFKQWWIWLLLVAINLLFAYGLYQQVYLGKPFGSNPGSDVSLVIFSTVSLLLTLLFLLFRLDTRIDEQGVSYRFFPFQLKYKQKKWSEIKKAYIRKYKPILEYGGWGMRFGAYNVSGNIGLQLELHGGDELLIGTRKPEEMEKAVLFYRSQK